MVSNESPFGDLLRDLRRRAGLSQQSLAEAAGLSVDAVAALERGRRRAPRAFTVRVLADALHLDEAGVDALHRAAVGRSAVAGSSAAVPPAPSGPLVGRTDDVARIVKMVQDGSDRLITLTGPGGIGKTRLALEVAATADQAFAAGVRWLPLESVVESGDIPALLTTALGVQSTAGRDLLVSAADHVGDRELLLVLDNCEHVVQASAEACATLLERTTRLRILATSRERLQVAGEVVWPVAPLDVPDTGSPPARLEAYGASKLFLEHARRLDPDFELSAADTAGLVMLCRRLDGVPLAVELAAARTDVMSVAEIIQALDGGLDVLRSGSRSGPVRHHTLLATLGWSFALLSRQEQAVFLRLAVFAGGATLPAARVVCAGGGIESSEVVGLLAALAAKSLVVRRDHTGPSRLGMLNTIRQYALGRLRSEGDLAAVQAKHASYVGEFAELAEAGLMGADERQWLDTVDQEAANVREAIAFAARTGQADLALSIAGALWRWCYLRGHYVEGRSWFSTALAAAGDCRLEVRAKALAGAGMLSFLLCEYGAARQQLEASRALHRQLENRRGEAWTLQRLGALAREEGRYDESERLHRDSMSVLEAGGLSELARRELPYLVFVQWLRGAFDDATANAAAALSVEEAAASAEGVAWGLLNLGAICLYRGDLAEADRLLSESLACAEEVGFREGTAWALNLVGLVALRRGDVDRARQRLGESLARHRALGDQWRSASVLEALAAVAVRTGDAAASARLLGAAEAIRRRVGTPVPGCEQLDRQATVDAACAALGPTSYETARLAGAALPLDRLVPPPPFTPAPANDRPGK